MYHIIGCIALFLAFGLLLILGSYDSKIGEFLGTLIVFPIIVFLLMIMLIVIYHKLNGQLNKPILGELIEKETEDNEISLNNDTDLYLFSNRQENVVNYWIKNHENIVIFQAECKLDNGIIELIQLYSQKADDAPALCIIKIDSDNYLVKDGQLIFGSLKVNKDSLYFYDANNIAVYSSIFDDFYENELNQAMDNILCIASLSPVDNKKSKILFIKDRTEKLIGKYFFALRNLDLDLGKKDNIDIRIPLIFSILVDIQQISQS